MMTVRDETDGASKAAAVAPVPVTLSVILTSHNRRELTLAALRSLRVATPAHVTTKIVLMDDGSSDGTGAAVAAEFPEVTVLRGSGDLFWNRGMLAAWSEAVKTQQDFFLWLNDDLAMNPTALGEMLDHHARMRAVHGEKIVIVGKTVSPSTQAVTYGGFCVNEGISKLSFRRMRDDEPVARTMNGNLVLLPARARDDIGLLSERYTHTFGDIDYGLRATEAGYKILQAPNPVGFQEYNVEYKRKISTLSRANWRFILLHPKGLPWREWLYFCRRHGGMLWPVNFVTRYAKLIVAGYK
jgi:GT2 family glycosyltransferase